MTSNMNKKNKNKCGFCDNTFSSASSLSHHRKVCQEKIRMKTEHEKEKSDMKDALEKEKKEKQNLQLQLDKQLKDNYEQNIEKLVSEKESMRTQERMLKEHKLTQERLEKEVESAHEQIMKEQYNTKKAQEEKQCIVLLLEKEKKKMQELNLLIDQERQEKLELITEVKNLKEKYDITKQVNTKSNNVNEYTSNTSQSSTTPVTLLIDVKPDNSKIICNFCNRDDFKLRANLARHKQTCGHKIASDKEIADLKTKLKEKEVRIEELTREKDAIMQLATTHGNTVHKSVSAITFLTETYKTTPALKLIEDHSEIKAAYKTNTLFVQHLISQYQNECLAGFIGDHLIKIYKKEDPQQQSIWNSDVDRLNFVIRELVDNYKKEWVKDKKGVKVAEKIIAPTLNYIKPLIKSFIKYCRDEITGINVTSSRQNEMGEYLRLATHIITLIDNKVLEKDVAKHMAPQLYWNKNALVAIENKRKIKEQEKASAKIKVIEVTKKENKKDSEDGEYEEEEDDDDNKSGSDSEEDIVDNETSSDSEEDIKPAKKIKKKVDKKVVPLVENESSSDSEEDIKPVKKIKKEVIKEDDKKAVPLVETKKKLPKTSKPSGVNKLFTKPKVVKKIKSTGPVHIEILDSDVEEIDTKDIKKKITNNREIDDSEDEIIIVKEESDSD